MNVWRPSADIETLKARAKLTQCVRCFFNERDVIEVETPALSLHSVTDPYLKAFSTVDPISGKTYYLQTSPEYAMKRLLCAGMPSIFYLGKAYRAEEKGHLHNAEFTMLEWYRLDFSMQDLIDEVMALIEEVSIFPLIRGIKGVLNPPQPSLIREGENPTYVGVTAIA